MNYILNIVNFYQSKMVETFNSKEDLEVHFFQVLDDDVKFLDGEIQLSDGFRGILDIYHSIYKVIKIIDDKIILADDDGFVVGNKKDFEVDDYAFRSNDSVMIKIDKEILDEKWVSKISKIYEDISSLSMSDVEDDNSFNNIIDKAIIEKITKEKLLEKEQYEKEEVKRDKKKEVDDKDVKEEFEKNSMGEFNDYKVDKKTITKTSGYKRYVLTDKNVNQVFNFDFLNGYGYNNRFNVDRIEDVLFEKQISFSEWGNVNENGIEVDKKFFEIEFKNGGIKVNGVKIKSSKLVFIFGRLNHKTTNDEIKMMNSLTGMKMDMLGDKELEFNDLKLDMKIDLVNNDLFKVSFLGKTKNMGWEVIKKVFFDDGKSRSFRHYFHKAEDILELGYEVGLGKQEIYDYLKKVNMLKSLGDDDDN